MMAMGSFDQVMCTSWTVKPIFSIWIYHLGLRTGGKAIGICGGLSWHQELNSFRGGLELLQENRSLTSPMLRCKIPFPNI